ncbi:DUF732 domain-containing protein [Mycobacterium simiae]|uniref:DUF732 domain-containing protein n=1 Tax=Mycobacterium simiae TaxID=1784 RepID=UPI00263A3619|nr:DUF732 domain-containing protein [Mycobacterium simiae]
MTEDVSTPETVEDYPETAAGTTAGAGGADTENLVIDYPPTGSTQPVAWSHEEDATDEIFTMKFSWGWVLGGAAVIALCGVVAALVIVLSAWSPGAAPAASPAIPAEPVHLPPVAVPAPSPPTVTLTATPQAAPPAPNAAPPNPGGSTRTWTPAQDREFLRQMRDSGIGYTKAGSMLGGAKSICVDFDGGMAYPKLASIVRGNAPNTDEAVREQYIGIAVRVLCPDHQDLLRYSG